MVEGRSSAVKVYLDLVGCRLNQSEIEIYARQFHAAGHTLVSHPEEADIAVINTCAVTAAAESDSRQKARQAARAGAREIVLTGCWATLHPKEAASLPGVSRVVPNSLKEQLVPNLLHISLEQFEFEPLARQLVPGARLRTRAFIKVQDGCDNHCTFCITTIARGKSRSRPLPEIIREIQQLLSGDAQEYSAKEIVLTGVHLGSWGQDFSPRLHLRHLVQAILTETDTPRLRLSSLEPWDLDEEFFNLWENPRLCRHIHLPLQSGCAQTLRRMGRKTTPQSFARLVSLARSVCPDIAITTDIIAGFPGESEAEFSESLNFIQAMDFAGGHVFTFSERPGTAAANMPNPVPKAVRKERNAEIQQVLEESAQRYRARFLGQTLPVLWEYAHTLTDHHYQLSGLTDNYLRVVAEAPRHLWNQITPVLLIGMNNGEMSGRLTE